MFSSFSGFAESDVVYAVFTCISNHFVLQNGELTFSNGRNSISRYFFSQKAKVSIILFQYTNVYLCAKFGDLMPTIDENRRPQIWTRFCAAVQGAETRFQK